MSCSVATSERLFIFNCAPSQARGKRRYRGQPGERLARGGAMNHQEVCDGLGGHGKTTFHFNPNAVRDAA
jgi:hypothetical protein